jgi:hypothetical protein
LNLLSHKKQKRHELHEFRFVKFVQFVAAGVGLRLCRLVYWKTNSLFGGAFTLPQLISEECSILNKAGSCILAVFPR